jgi:hypothetical protein
VLSSRRSVYLYVSELSILKFAFRKTKDIMKSIDMHLSSWLRHVMFIYCSFSPFPFIYFAVALAFLYIPFFTPPSVSFSVLCNLNEQGVGQTNPYTATIFHVLCRSWLRHYVTSRKVANSIPDEVIRFYNWPNPSSRTMALGSTQPLTEMSTRNLPGGEGRPVRKADNFTAICEPIV